MIEISGKYASAIAFANDMEEYAIAQIRQICDQAAFEGSQIRIMPDVHPGKVGPVGLTATVTDKIIPSVVGIDLGCGMTIAKLKQRKIEYQKLDRVIREKVPSGFQIRREPHHMAQLFDFNRLHCQDHIQMQKAVHSIGTLGGGNHFIEVDQDATGNLYILIHSGSRHLGKETAEYYLTRGHQKLKEQNSDIPYELTYLEGDLKEDYLHDVTVIQEFAELNRQAILYELVKSMKWKVIESWSCIHNYIDASGDKHLIRKGAISAEKGQRVIIPVNMRDGVILGIGKGNEDWNCSAPHGAGRIGSRQTITSTYTVSQFKKAMKGIYSTCIGKGTLDEAPFAYRSMDNLIGAIEDTVEIVDILKPVYNYKSNWEG